MVEANKKTDKARSLSNSGLTPGAKVVSDSRASWIRAVGLQKRLGADGRLRKRLEGA